METMTTLLILNFFIKKKNFVSERLSVRLSSCVSFQFLDEITFLGQKFILIKLVKCLPIPKLMYCFEITVICVYVCILWITMM